MKILVVTLFHAIAATAVYASDCVNLSHYSYFQVSSNGYDLHEYDISTCDKIILTEFHIETEEELPEHGSPEWKKVKERIIPVGPKWNCTKYSSETGKCMDQYRFFWNENRTILTFQLTEKESFPKSTAEREFEMSKTFTREGHEIVMRGENRSRRRSEHTRNEWLVDSKQYIEAFTSL